MEKIKLLLFIDDDFATNFYHKIIVRDSGLVEKYLFFSSANEALSYFKEQAALGNPEKPDAIFLDINELNPLVRGLKNKPLTATHLEELQKDLTLIA